MTDKQSFGKIKLVGGKLATGVANVLHGCSRLATGVANVLQSCGRLATGVATFKMTVRLPLSYIARINLNSFI